MEGGFQVDQRGERFSDEIAGYSEQAADRSRESGRDRLRHLRRTHRRGGAPVRGLQAGGGRGSGACRRRAWTNSPRWQAAAGRTGADLRRGRGAEGPGAHRSLSAAPFRPGKRWRRRSRPFGSRGRCSTRRADSRSTGPGAFFARMGAPCRTCSRRAARRPASRGPPPPAISPATGSSPRSCWAATPGSPRRGSPERHASLGAAPRRRGREGRAEGPSRTTGCA